MTGPPLGPVFSLAGRPASGLYAGAWLSFAVGAGLLGVALAASLSGNSGGAALLAIGAFLAFFGAAVLASGYQAISRRVTRPAGRYRGPSPLLIFVAVFAAANVVGAIIALTGLDASMGRGVRALVSIAFVVPLYALLVWVLVVREGALSWWEMGWPRPSSGREWAKALGDLGYGLAFTLPVLVATVLLAALLAGLLEVIPPPVLPIPVSAADWALVLVVAVILAPLGEELFFRGFAQTAWTRDLGWRGAVIRTAVFFSLVHAISTTGVDFSEGLRLAAVATVARLPVSLGLGWVFARTGSIAAPVALHAAFNGLMLVLASLASSMQP